MALEAILAGAEWKQFPSDSVLTLSHTLGNTALLELASLRDTGPEVQTAVLPRSGFDAVPTLFGGGDVLMTAPPDFAALGPMGDAAPLAV